MIPKIIHQLWKTDVIPEEYASFANNWKALHPTWQYKLWTDEMLVEFVATEYPNFVTTYNTYPHHIQRVDVARYLILNSIGGVYTDLDMEPVNAIDNLLTVESIFATEHPADARRMGVKVLVSNAFMATAPNTRTFERIIYQLAHDSPRMYIDKRLTVLHSTGPVFLTKNIKHDDVLLLPSDAFFSKSIYGVTSPTSRQIYGIHHFASTWW